MPTIDITQTPYNAVADGRWAADVFSVNVGSTPTKLTAANNQWTSGVNINVGDFITVGGAGGAGPGGGSAFSSTVASIIDAKNITLAGSMLSDPSTVTGGDGRSIVSWGHTDNANGNISHASTPFFHFHDDYQGLTVTLTIPAGIYYCSYGQDIFTGITNLTVNATGATLTGQTIVIGSGGQIQNNTSQALVASVSPGATQVTCITHSEAARFPVGSHALLTGFDLQAGGFPTNHYLFEFLPVATTNATTGVVTFSTPITKTYKDTWPNYNVGNAFAPYYGGPATLYTFTTTFECTHVYNGLTLVQNAQTGAPGDQITLNNVTYVGTFGNQGLAASGCRILTLSGFDQSTSQMEVDKYIDAFNVTSSSLNSMTFQSSTVNHLTVTSSTITNSIFGTPIKSTITGSTIGQFFSSGPTTYGHSESVSCTNCVMGSVGDSTFHLSGYSIAGNGFRNLGINNATNPPLWLVGTTYAAGDSVGGSDDHVYASVGSGNIGHDPVGDGGVHWTDTGQFRSDFINSMTAGVLKITNNSYVLGAGPPTRWAATGGRVFWSDLNHFAYPGFLINDVTTDGTYTYIHTDWLNNDGLGGFPTGIYNGLLSVRPHPCTSATFINCSATAPAGTNDNSDSYNLSQFSGAAPLYSRYRRTVDTTTALQPYWPMVGRLVSLTVDVQVAYTGATNPCTYYPVGQFGCNTIIDESNWTDTTWSPAIDLRTAGKRIITYSSRNPMGADANLTITKGWFSNSYQPGMTDIHTESTGLPTVVVTGIFDQGFTSAGTQALARLSLRLHG